MKRSDLPIERKSKAKAKQEEYRIKENHQFTFLMSRQACSSFTKEIAIRLTF
jgi:hypothetical protein